MRPSALKFTQERHCCLMLSEDDPSVHLELHDGGGGEFLVLNATHWAMDSEEEIDLLAAEMKAMLKGAKK